MKNNPVQDKSPVHGDDYVILPEPRTAINICSKNIMNVTISQSSLSVFQNLAKVMPRPRKAKLQQLGSQSSSVAVFIPPPGVLSRHEL